MDLMREPDHEEIRSALARLLAAPSFKASERNRRFLSYVVDKTLAGETERIKAYTIAVDVFGRGADFDPTLDAIVRNEAGRLRAALTAYHALDGAAEPVIIELPTGSYVPRFVRRGPVAGADRPAWPGLPEPAHQAPAGSARPQALDGLALPVLQSATGDAPAVAVMATGGDGPGFRVQMSDGLARSVVVAMGGYPGLKVVRVSDRASLDRVAARRKAIGQTGRLYLLEVCCDIEKAQIRCCWTLSDPCLMTVIESSEIMRSSADRALMSIEAELAETIARHVGGLSGMLRLESRRPEVAGPLEGYDCVLRAKSAAASQDPAAVGEPLACLERTIERNPHYSDAWAMLGMMLLNQVRNGWAPCPDHPVLMARALVAADQAVRLSVNSSLAHQVRAAVLFQHGAFAEFETAARRSIELAPGNPEPLVHFGNRLFFMGRFDEGAAIVRNVLELELSPRSNYYLVPSWDAYRRGDLDEAIRFLRAARIEGSFYMPHAAAAAIYAAAGDRPRSAFHLAALLKLRPDYAAEFEHDFRARGICTALIELFADGLRLAGLPLPGSGQQRLRALG